MAKTVNKLFYVSIGGTEYSGVIRGVDLNVTVDEQETTNGDSGDWKEFIGGLKGAECNLDLVKDSDLSGLDAAMWSALGTSVAVVTKRQDASVSASNPTYSFSAIVLNWSPFSGSVGDVYSGTLRLLVTGAVTRATS